MRLWVFLYLFFMTATGFSQDKPLPEPVQDSATTKKTTRIASKQFLAEQPERKITIADYKSISYQNDTTHLDTTLTIQKEYQFNYLRRDAFQLLPFSNLGQTYTSLTHIPDIKNIYPRLGARAKHFNYMETEDISYYYVPTPLTELFFKTAMEQGQLLDAFITVNTSPQFNFSLAYKGLRSLGKYQHILSSTGNFRFTANYHTKNGRYRFRGHVVTQDILNQENGGIVNETDFESGNEQFRDRSLMNVQFENAENLLEGKRYFAEQELTLAQKKDSLTTYRLALGHGMVYETKFYQFNQDAENAYFGEAFQPAKLMDRAKLQTFRQQLQLSYSSAALGEWKIKALQYHYNYFFKSILYTESGVITNRLRDVEYALGASWKHKIGALKLSAEAVSAISATLGGRLLHATATYSLDEDKQLRMAAAFNQRMPDFNFLLYHSDYSAYNWQHTDTFTNQRTQQIEAAFFSSKWLSIAAAVTLLNKYSYFAMETGGATPQVAPFQYDNTIRYLHIKLEKEFKLGKFSLNNTLLYQDVNQPDAVLNLPAFTTRNTLYYSTYLFKKALYLQTGITCKYFTAYTADAYNPLLGEFYVQQEKEIGGFPMFDFFINGKIRQTRFYLKAEHFNSSLTGYNFYAAPNYPYRDFIVRFGLVWNFFL